jgi:hypothetical protein
MSKAASQKRRDYKPAKVTQFEPGRHCYVCGRHLDDPSAIDRGIGSECWQGVLAAIDQKKSGGAA